MSNSLKLVALGEVLAAKDGRSYYSAEFQDPANPFAATRKRNFWQQNNSAGVPEWRGADPAIVKSFVGKLIPGAIVSAEVEPFMIGEREVTIYTTVVLGNELSKQVFKSLGHPMLEAVAETVAEELPLI